MVSESGEAYWAIHSAVQKWRNEGRTYEWIESQLLDAGLSKQEVYDYYYEIAAEEKSNWFYYFFLGLLFSAAVELVVSALALPFWYSFSYSVAVLLLTLGVYLIKSWNTSKRVALLTGMVLITWLVVIVRLALQYIKW